MADRARRFPLVDSLRAFAALSVLFYHLSQGSPLHDVPVLGDAAVRLNVGVAIFFLISGMLLYRPFVAARVDGKPLPFVGAYAWRRFLRIVPAYWVALTVLLIWIKPAIATGSGILTYYGFAQIYRPSTILGGIAAAWSLAVELSFYAFLPLWALALRRIRGRTPAERLRSEWIAVAALGLAGLVWRTLALKVHPAPSLGAVPQFVLPAYIGWFACGMAVGVLTVALEHREGLPRGLRWIERRPELSWLGAAAAFAILCYGIGLKQGGSTTARQAMEVHVLSALVGLGLLLPAVVAEQAGGAVRRVMAWKVLVWLGLVSYGIYIWQGLVFVFLARWTALPELSVFHPDWWWIPLGAAGSIFAAALSYYIVERPALSLKRLVTRPAVLPDQPGAASAPGTPG